MEKNIKTIFLSLQKNYKKLKIGGAWSRSRSPQAKASAPPLVSIITVIKDNPHALEDTIQSVLSQSCKNKEQLIIDGGSTQETLEVLARYEQKIDFWLSHIDQGIYDAMNRGTLLARGTWLLFLNAGDYFYTSESLLELLSYCDEQAELVYGDHEVRYSDKNYSRIHFSPSIRSYYDLWHHMGFCHQSLIVRKDIQSKNLFDNNNLSADYKFVLGSFLRGNKIQHVPVIAASVDTWRCIPKKTYLHGNRTLEGKLGAFSARLAAFGFFLDFMLYEYTFFYTKTTREKIYSYNLRLQVHAI